MAKSRLNITVPNLKEGRTTHVMSLKSDSRTARAILRQSLSASDDRIFQPIRTPSDLSSLDCIGLHVTGEDITPEDSEIPAPRRCGSSLPNSVRDPGTVRGLVPITGGTLSLDVDLGAEITVQLFGLSTADGNCAAASALFTSADSSASAKDIPFELASSRVTIVEDTEIRMTPELDPSSLQPVFCDASEAPIPDFSVTSITIAGGTYDPDQLPDLTVISRSSSLEFEATLHFGSHLAMFDPASGVTVTGGAILEFGLDSTEMPGAYRYRFRVDDLDALSISVPDSAARDLFNRPSYASATDPADDLRSELERVNLGGLYAAHRLSFLTYPLQNLIGAPLAPTLSVGITDLSGNLNANLTDTVTLSAYTDSGCKLPVSDSSVLIGSPLAGATTGGIFHAPGLRITQSGTYYFKAVSGFYSSTCSGPIDIHAAGQLAGTTDNSVCYLTGGGASLCWGASSIEGRHGFSHSVALPQRPRSSKAAWKIAAGTRTYCWLLPSGHVECLGEGDDGELGNGTDADQSLNATRVIDSNALELSDIIDLAGGGINGVYGSLFCALKKEGSVWCWAGTTISGGTAGGLGNGSFSGDSNVAVQVSGLTDAVSISVGDRFACAIRKTGTLACWGRNTFGNLGDSSTTQRNTPVQVPGLDRVNQLAMFRMGTCALRDGGELWCWGNGSEGGLASSSNSNSYTPVRSPFTQKFRTIAGNLYRTFMCGALWDGTVRCWGENDLRHIGETDLGGFVYSPTEPFPGSLTGIQALGSTTATDYAVTRDGTVYSWGRAGAHALGIGPIGFFSRPTDSIALNSETGSVVQVVGRPSLGANHTCIRMGSGTLKCSGGNHYGAVGAGTRGLARMDLVTVLNDAIDVAVSESFSCAVRTNGTLACWGENNTSLMASGQNFTGLLKASDPSEYLLTPTAPSVIGLSSTLAQVAVTENTICVRSAAGEIYCWGDNRSGQLGPNATAINTQDVSTAYQIPLPAGRSATKLVSSAVTVSGSSTYLSTFCALLDNQVIHCWGNDAYGALGRGTTPVQSVSTPNSTVSAVSGIANAVDIKAGSGYFCAKLAAVSGGGTGSNLSCWGIGTNRQLGVGTASVSTPVVPNLAGASVVDYDLTFRSTCAILPGPPNTVHCWGSNTNASTGQGYLLGTTAPSTVTGATGATQIYGVSEGFLVKLDSGTWMGWGENFPNQLMLDPGAYTALTPWTVQTPPRLAAGASHTCRVRLDGQVECWGLHTSGQLGAGNTISPRSSTPILVPGLSNAYTISAGNNHTCVIVADGTLQCWGNNTVSGSINSSSPAAVSLGGISDPNVSRIASGSNHTCVTYASSMNPGIRARCWGVNSSGQLGMSSITDQAAPSTDLTNISNTMSNSIEAISAGANHTCVQIRGGSLRCFGENGDYQLNDLTTTDRGVAAPAAANQSVHSQLVRSLSWAASGGNHTCGVLSDFSGRVACQGYNAHGQFGDGTTDGSSATKTVTYASGITTAEFGILAAGGNHTCVGLKDGTVRCWGLGTDGQLGQGSGASSLTPVATSALTGVVREIAAGEAHTCVRTSNTIQCFGRGSDGQLGNGVEADSSTPVTVLIQSL